LYDTPSIIGGGALYHLFINQNIVSNSLGFRVSGGPTAQPLLTSGLAQYPISCLSDTGDGIVPGSNLWATDLWVRDSPSGFVIGRIPHVLLCKTTTLALGNLVKINTVINGITDQRIWLVAANYGADKLLMRVYTEGIE
jgi:hypothetical protein